MTRRIVDNQEDLTALTVFEQVFEKHQKSFSVEDISKLKAESCMLKAHSAIDMGGLALTVGVDSGLFSNSRPSAVQGAVQPEAGLVFKEDVSTASSGFF